MYSRPLLVGGVAIAVFVTALLVALTVPAQERRAASLAPSPPRDRPDTLAIRARIASAAREEALADTALARARVANAAAAARPAEPPASPLSDAERDSLARRAAELDRLLRRAKAAPLFDSYRALADAPEVRAMPRVSRLLDTLSAIERSRDAFGATGGVDPIYVALTERATQVGKSIQRIAEDRRAAIEDRLRRAEPGPVVASVDTVPLLRRRDAAVASLASANRWLQQARLIDRDLDRRAARARSAAAVGASVPAMLGAALALGGVLGFGVALLLEMRTPRVADADEAEEIADARVLVSIASADRAPERRRRADREVPPLLDLGSDAYRLLFAQLADRTDNLARLGVVGDDALVTALVAANLGATIARQVRTVLLVDGDATTHSLTSVTRQLSTAGLADVLAGRLEWTEAVRGVTVGRGRTVDVLATGVFDAERPLAASSEELTRLVSRVGRRYESVIASLPFSSRADAVAAARCVGDVVVCVRATRTEVRTAAEMVSALRAGGVAIRGLVLWQRSDPTLWRG